MRHHHYHGRYPDGEYGMTWIPEGPAYHTPEYHRFAMWCAGIFCVPIALFVGYAAIASGGVVIAICGLVFIGVAVGKTIDHKQKSEMDYGPRIGPNGPEQQLGDYSHPRHKQRRKLSR